MVGMQVRDEQVLQLRHTQAGDARALRGRGTADNSGSGVEEVRRAVDDDHERWPLTVGIGDWRAGAEHDNLRPRGLRGEKHGGEEQKCDANHWS